MGREMCQGFQVHVTDRERFKPYYTTLALLVAIRELHRTSSPGVSPPYEYETERLPIDLLDRRHGDSFGIGAEPTAAEFEADWQGDLKGNSWRRVEFTRSRQLQKMLEMVRPDKARYLRRKESSE